MQGFWATREVISYQFYLIAGMVVALHLDDVHQWIVRHVRLVLAVTVAAAVVAEVWYVPRRATTCRGSARARTRSSRSSSRSTSAPSPASTWSASSLVDRRRSTRIRAVIRSGSDNSYGVRPVRLVPGGGLRCRRAPALLPVDGTAGVVAAWAFVMLLHFSRTAFFFLSALVLTYSQITRPMTTGHSGDAATCSSASRTWPGPGSTGSTPSSAWRARRSTPGPCSGATWSSATTSSTSPSCCSSSTWSFRCYSGSYAPPGITSQSWR